MPHASPVSRGTFQFAAFGSGLRTLYNESLIAHAGTIARGQRTIEVRLPHTVTRGAIELRENLTAGQAISNYTVEFASADVDSAEVDGAARNDTAASLVQWQVLALRNEGCLTIGNRRIQHWTGTNVSGTVRLTVSTLQLASGQSATPHVRSVRIMDWSSSELDGILTGILAVN